MKTIVIAISVRSLESRCSDALSLSLACVTLMQREIHVKRIGVERWKRWANRAIEWTIKVWLISQEVKLFPCWKQYIFLLLRPLPSHFYFHPIYSSVFTLACVPAKEFLSIYTHTHIRACICINMYCTHTCICMYKSSTKRRHDTGAGGGVRGEKLTDRMPMSLIFFISFVCSFSR